FDRWGYGPTPAPQRSDWSLRRFAADIRCMRECFGWATAAAVGISGGGPFACAAAAGLGDACSRLALVSPVGPLVGGGVIQAARRDMSAFHKLAFFVSSKPPGLIRGVFGTLGLLLQVDGRLAMRTVTARACARDREIALAPETAQRLAGVFREGLNLSSVGPVIDLHVFSRAWDLDLNAIKAVSRVWIGTQDRNVPVKAAKALAELLPNSSLEVLADEGHFWVSRNYPTVMTWLADALEVEVSGSS
ncbi:MAG: alpha/beta fold hydrolase, partial [Pseudomonadota bacterium]